MGKVLNVLEASVVGLYLHMYFHRNKHCGTPNQR